LFDCLLGAKVEQRFAGGMSNDDYRRFPTQPASAPPAAPPSDNPRVLVIDDDEDVARAYGKILALAGYEPVVRTDPSQASLEVVTRRFAAIISDIKMPKISGTELLSVVRSYDEEVPVILVTGHGSLETAMEAVSLRSTEYLLKPVDPPVLLAAVKKGIARAASVSAKKGISAPPREVLNDAFRQIWLAFQPIHTARGGLFGYEALLRSRHATYGRPDVLLGAAAASDRMQELGRIVRAKAAAIVPELPRGALLFVNLHASDLLDDDLFDAASPLGRVADRVMLEVTERDQMEDPESLNTRLYRLRGMGFRFAVDDLGAGYSGLTSLVQLEPEMVKIDMGLVRNVHESFMRQSVIKSLVELARTTSIGVVAEGIETPAEHDCVKRLGCDYMQGFLLGRPADSVRSPGGA
jgi:EAL domain-containing protein (putative c-di-GMP-specific phosphodiesterase class I)/CheY-like chemotaxis protein